jgi:hypothetical protein
MVKNAGGNKAKRGARKHTIPQTMNIRKKNPNETCELYATLIKVYGGSNCEVLCEDGVTRNCIIRNKFRGRGKQDNFLAQGVLVLIGRRDWEVKHPNKKETCDLLCVYKEDEKLNLKQNGEGNWKILEVTNPEENVNTDICFDTNDDALPCLESKPMESIQEWSEIDVDDI